jgi:hypothetical protein
MKQLWRAFMASIDQGKFQLHAARATANTTLKELGFTDEVVNIQMQHAHAGRGDVQRAYDHSKLLLARHRMMCRWSKFVIDQAGKVIPFPAAPKKRSA